MRRKELFAKIENAFKMVIAVGGRKFLIVRDKEDRLFITERDHRETLKCYKETGDLLKRYKIDGKPLREYNEAITIEKYVALLDA